MFGLSTWEILIILAVALIFVGPDQLPKVARQIGKGVRQVRGVVGKVDDEMRRAVREASAELDDDGNPVNAPAPDPTPADPGALPRPSGSEAESASAPPPRDWSQVGKAPVPGAVATGPSRPTPGSEAPAPAPEMGSTPPDPAAST